MHLKKWVKAGSDLSGSKVKKIVHKLGEKALFFTYLF
jgi:hypothetical protein